MERNEGQRKTAKQGTWSLRVAACRYAAVLRLAESGLSSEAEVKRAWEDLERAALAHARKARAA